MNRLALTLLALPLAFPLAGCNKIPDLSGVLDKLEDYTPKLSFNGIELKKLSWEGADVDFKFLVDNPNPVTLGLASLSYDLGLEGNQLLKGTQEEGIQLSALNTSPVTLPVSVKFEDMLGLVGSAGGKDELGFNIQGEFGFDTPLGRLNLPYDHDGKLPVLRKPKVSLDGFRMGKVDWGKQTAAMELDFKVKNEQNAKYGLKNLNYKVKLSGKSAASGKIKEAMEVAGGGEKVITLPIDLDFLSLGVTLIQGLVNKDAIDVQLVGDLEIDTPLGALPLSFDKSKSLKAR